MRNGKVVGLRSKREPSIAEALARLVREKSETSPGEAIGEDVVKVANSVQDIRRRSLIEAPSVAEEIIALGGRCEWDNDTVNRILEVLREACDLAYTRWAWLEEDVARRIRTIEPEAERKVGLTLSQVEEIAFLCKRREVADLIRLAAYIGLRQEDLIGLDPRAHGRVQDGEIRLRGEQERGGPIHPRVEGALWRLPYPWQPKTIGKWWAEARDAAQLPQLRFDDLRKAESGRCPARAVDKSAYK